MGTGGIEKPVVAPSPKGLPSPSGLWFPSDFISSCLGVAGVELTLPRQWVHFPALSHQQSLGSTPFETLGRWGGQENKPRYLHYLQDTLQHVVFIPIIRGEGSSERLGL